MKRATILCLLAACSVPLKLDNTDGSYIHPVGFSPGLTTPYYLTTPKVISKGSKYTLDVYKVDSKEGFISFYLRGYNRSTWSNKFEGTIFWGVSGSSHYLKFLEFGYVPIGGWGLKDPNGYNNYHNHSANTPLFGNWPKISKPDWAWGMMFAGWRNPWKINTYHDPNFCISMPGLSGLTLWWQVAIKENGKWESSDKWEVQVRKQ